MNWRVWMYNHLTGDVGVTTLVPADRIMSLLEEVPVAKPFIIIRMEDSLPDIPTAMFQDTTLWVHGDPDDGYTVIDDVLSAVRNCLVGPVSDDGGISVSWQGDSVDLSDDVRGTILKTSSYRLVGRR